jgi:putative ABC transport system ATP-binding protein
MTLLALDAVSKTYRRGSRDRNVLQEVSMCIDAGELVVVLGTRKSGRTTLLRIAAGLERPDSGTVRCEGTELAKAREVVGRKIAFCRTTFSPMEGELVYDHVAAPLLAQRVGPSQARRAAESALERAAVKHTARMRPDELDSTERVRVAIARAIVVGPQLLVVDDPARDAAPLHSDAILRLLRSLASPNGPAVLMSTDDATAVAGADRVLSLDAGRLRSQAETPTAEVVPLRARRRAADGAASSH